MTNGRQDDKWKTSAAWRGSQTAEVNGTKSLCSFSLLQFGIMREVTVGIVSIGDMGLGIAKLLKTHGYRVVTVGEGRSEHTLARIEAANITALPTDDELAVQADYILSIVPPVNALATAERIAKACMRSETASRRATLEDVNGQPTRSPLYLFELNATSSRLAEEIGALFLDPSMPGEDPCKCRVLDGGIIGGPPSPNPDGTWRRPSVWTSPPTFAGLADVLNMKVVSARIGAASTLKLSFAALTKGLTALSILSFSTAQQEELLPELLDHLQQYSPHIAALTSAGVIGMSPKAYRWVDEMRYIGEAFDREGCWGGVGRSVYDGFAEVYRTVAEDTILGQERVGARQRGTNVEGAVTIIADRRRKQSGDNGP
ncbi:hypothetical protein N7468_005239 [Penicillium chermesinum]|uniref:Phosphogluconate dehydrogenase NAD-binding putative C-terminal domain-containing protein n=1 Tax=Penicillium chermesinum TaxID=63820 RepID=A0A9W9TN69_9EURO|nr:uncharacterized protein N7468_005239 [Penicillium chermesinum]KAJ5232283.1 hypothetical protein N7468_005239 [Penicillium chermesinum]